MKEYNIIGEISSIPPDIEVERDFRAPYKKPEEDMGMYFRRIMEWSDKAKEVPIIHEKWKNRHLHGVRDIDYRQRIIVVLKELMQTGFLRYDYFDTGIIKDDERRAREEIEKQGLQDVLEIDGACWKFALLGQLRFPDDKRIIISENNAGYYINEMYSKLTKGDIDVFCRFVAFVRLVYHDLEEQDKEKFLKELIDRKKYKNSVDVGLVKECIKFIK